MTGQPTGDTGGRRRWSAPFAVVVGLAYVVWRAYDTLDGVRPWLAISALVVETAGVLGTTALLLALRRPRRPRRRDVDAATDDTSAADDTSAGERLGPVDVVIRFDGQAVGHLHATLAGVRHMFDVQRIAVVTNRIDVATKAVAGTAAVVVPADPTDATRLRTAADFGDAPFLALFDAGDVPQPGFTGALRSEFVDPSVAVVQGCLAVDGVDSAERDARGRHELRFEREVLNPSLGARGGAVLLGSGAMVRRATLRDISVPRGARRSAELRWSIKVRAAGLALLAPPRPIVSAASVNTDHAVSVARRGDVRAAVATMLSRHDPLWTMRLRVSHRSGYLAWMVRPLSGLRRLAFLGVLLACIGVGSAPIRPQSSAWIVVGLWAAWFALQGLSVQQCSDGVLQVGDRARWSMRTMGASVAALFGAGRPPAGPVAVPIDAARDGSWRGAGRDPFLVLALFVIAAVSVTIGIDRWHHFLPDSMTDDVDGWTRAGLAGVSVWTVAVMLDVMRCLVGGPQLRAHQRLRVRLDATVDGNAARLMNLSPRGASVSFDDDADLIVGDQVTMRFLVPTGSGTTAEVATIATVRSERLDQTDRGLTLVCGVEFGAMDRVSADALFAYCSVVHPDRLAMEGPAEQQLAAELVAGPSLPQRLIGVRALGLLALVGIGAAMMPPYGETSAAAAADPRSSITVRVVNQRTGDGVEGATITASCVAAARVVDDGDEVRALEQAAIETTRTQLLARAGRAAEDAAARDLRRETPPSKQAAQHARWLDTQRVAAASAPISSVTRFSSAAAGWHRVPAVAIDESPPLAADDAGDGTYVVTDLPGWPCRVEATSLPAGYVAAPIGPTAGDLVQFADGGGVVNMAIMPGAVADEPVIEIGDRVWVDVDGDGLQGPSEPGLAGATITLTADDSEHQVVTDQNGSFRFSNDPNGRTATGVAAGIAELRVGATVQIQAPLTVDFGAGTFHLTAAGAGRSTDVGSGAAGDAAPPLSGPSIDSSVDPDSGLYTFSIQSAAGGLVDHTIDIGYSRAYALGDRVWLDADNDGLLDSTEQGVDGVTVLLYVDQAGDGVPDGPAVDAQITSEGGFYDFIGLPAGRYVVEVHPPDGMVSSTGAIGRSEGPYEPADGVDQPGDQPGDEIGVDTTSESTDDGTMLSTGVIRSASISLGSVDAPNVRAVAGVDFGLFPARSIDDAVWLDEDGDGVLSPDEPGLAGVPMVLLQGDQVLAITSTDAEGDFVFPNLTLDDYTVQIHAPPGLRPIDALPPQTDEGELIGEPEAAPDPSTAGSEPGTDTATVTVLDPALDALDGTIDGVFNGVIEESVAITAPPAETTTTNDPDDPSVDSPLTVQPTALAPADDPAFEVVEVSVAPDWAGTDAGRALQRFGLWAPRSIGHMVWEDADDDGAIDPGESGIPGIEVRLLEGDRVVGRTLSAVDGTYRFVDLPDGTYRLSVDVPPTWRTSSIGWDDPVAAVTGIDNGLPTRATNRVAGPPIRIGRVGVNASQSFEHANIGLFQPRPTVVVDASVRGCSPSSATGANGPRGTCVGTAPAAAAPQEPGGAAPPDDTPDDTPADDTPDDTPAGDDNPIVVTGSTITVDYLVRNTGNVPMSGLTVDDDVVIADNIDCNGTVAGNGQPLLLEVGHSVTCTTSGRVSAGQGRRTATVTASAESAPGTVTEIEPVVDTTYWFGAAAGLASRTFVTTVSPGADLDGDGELDAPPAQQFGPADDADRPASDATAAHVVGDGTRVWWVYEVHNTGTVPLSEVTVADRQRGRICGDLVLAPGEHRFCVAPATLTRAGSDNGRYRALADVTAVDTSDPSKRVPIGPVSEAAHAFVVRPQLEIAVLIDGSPAPSTPLAVTSGNTVELSYSVTNSGDLAYEWVALSDAAAGLIDCPELNVGRGGLEPGETVTCTVRRQLDAAPPAADNIRPDVAGSAEGLPTTVETLVRAEGQPFEVEGETPANVIVETTWTYVAASFAAGDEAFIDTDGDAERDALESPMAGIEVRVLDDLQQVVVTSTTDGAGRWSVTSLPPGVYSIEYVVPDGFAAAMSSPDGIRIVQPDPDTRSVVSDPVLIDDPVDVPSWPLALVQLASISDEVWLDTDADGLRAASEPGVSDVVVAIFDAAGSMVGQTTTDAAGRWSFEALPPGEYDLSVVAPDGYRVHRLGADESSIQTLSVQLTSPGIDDTGAVGTWLTPVSRVEDRVWDDDNGDGWLTEGERGMARVIVTLVPVPISDGDGGGDAGGDAGGRGGAAPIAATTTDSIGRFTFEAVPPGEYVIALGAVADGTPIESLLRTPPPPLDAVPVPASGSVSGSASGSDSVEGTDPVPVSVPASAVRSGGPAAVVTVDGSPAISAGLSLAVTPETRARIVPGRVLIDQPSILDPADLLPATGAEWGQAAVFIACMLVFSSVVATSRRRRLR